MPSEPRLKGAVAVIQRNQRFLVIRRSQQVRAPGAYCFPGGGIEGDESEAETLHREMQEELACSVTPLRPVWRSLTGWGVSLVWWLCDLDESVQPVPNPAEVESVHWMTAGQMRANPKLLSSNLDFLDALEKGEFTLDSSHFCGNAD